LAQQARHKTKAQAARFPKQSKQPQTVASTGAKHTELFFSKQIPPLFALVNKVARLLRIGSVDAALALAMTMPCHCEGVLPEAIQRL